jgi:hypothetical protein
MYVIPVIIFLLLLIHYMHIVGSEHEHLLHIYFLKLKLARQFPKNVNKPIKPGASLWIDTMQHAFLTYIFILLISMQMLCNHLFFLIYRNICKASWRIRLVFLLIYLSLLKHDVEINADKPILQNSYFLIQNTRSQNSDFRLQNSKFQSRN